MNFFRRAQPPAAAGVKVVQEAASLTDFPQAECAGMVWHRQPPATMLSWLDSLEPVHLPRGRVILARDEVAETVARMCEASGLPKGPERDWLCADITSLADTFSALMGVQHLRVRLDVIDNNACRKFHVDAISARLICTYRGTGTQYGTSRDQRDPAQIHTVATGTPILLRGTLWSAEPHIGLLHRSPPIEGTGETRLVLVLDPIFDLENAQ